MAQRRSVGPVTGATTAAAAFTTIIFYTLKAIWGIEVEGEVQGAFTTLIIVIAGWLVPPQDDDVVEETYDIGLDDSEDGGELYG